MHPPPFHLNHRLSDWPECRLELRCCGVVLLPVRLLVARHGDQTFAALVARLRCRTCRGRPAPVYLCAGEHREHCHGKPPDWAIEIVPAPPGR